ncbi:MAG: hypothetical protein U5K54_26315 [Cytophagales bacterium]|nr:hypothetical protein [Cytophagales bacterium]
MAQGISLHIGLNAVDPAHYGTWDGQLVACEADAEDMQLIANDRGFASRILLTKDAIRKTVIDNINYAAAALSSGDFFFVLLRSRWSASRFGW